MTRPLQALRVGNFKAFSDSQRIPLKPITLIFGPNSAGKSSFIHSLALAHEAQFGREKRSLSRLDVHHTDVGGSAIDLGGFRQYVHRGQLNRRVEWGAELKVSALAAGKDQRLAQLLASVETVSITIALGIELDDQDRPKSGAAPRIDSVEVTGDGAELLRMSSRSGDGQVASLRLDRVASDHPVFRQVLRAIIESTTTSETMTDEDFEGVDEVIYELLPQLLIRMNQFFPGGVELPKTEGADRPSTNMLFAISKGNRKEDIGKAVHFYFPRMLNDLLEGLATALADELKKFQYLGPLRTLPPRHLAFAENDDKNWFAGGGFAWDELRRNKSTRDAVNGWLNNPKRLKTSYQIVSRRMISEGNTLLNLVERSIENVASGRFSAAPSKLVSNLLVQLEDAEMRGQEISNRSARIASESFDLAIRKKEAQLAVAELDKINLVEKINTTKATRDQTNTKREYAEAKEVMVRLIDRLEGLNQSIENGRVELKELLELRHTNSVTGKLSIYESEKRNLALRKLRDLLETYQQEFGDTPDYVEVKDGVRSSAIPHDEEDIGSVVQSHIDELFPDALQDLKLIDVTKNVEVTHRDVGIGISQVLPVLVMAYGSSDKLLAIEQPEIHLHPALQAELADVFIESALGERKNTFILETHSEHLILRLMRRMRETYQGKNTGLYQVTPADVSVLYVEPDGTRSIIRDMPLNELGELVKSWPGGFFEEGLREQFDDA